MAQQRRLAGRADAGGAPKTLSVMPFPRRPRWWRSAKRWASSRMCWSTRSAAEPSSSSSGSGRPGRNTSSRFFARLTIGHVLHPGGGHAGERRAQLALAAVDHDEAGARRERRVFQGVIRAKRRVIASSMRAKSSGPPS